MLKILVSDDVILFIEHVVSFCACAMDITKYFKRAIFSILTSLCERSELSGLFNGTDFLYNMSCRKCSKIMFLRVSKYPPNAIFRNANTQRANVTSSMIWHTNPRPPM